MGAVRVDADRVLLSLRFGSASDVPRRYRLASWNSRLPCRWSLPIPFLNYEVSHSNLGLAARLLRSNISFDRLRRLLRRHAMKQAAPAAVHTSTFIMLVILLHVSQNWRTSYFLCMFCYQFYSKFHKLCILLCGKLILKQFSVRLTASSDRKPVHCQPPANKIHPLI